MFCREFLQCNIITLQYLTLVEWYSRLQKKMSKEAKLIVIPGSPDHYSVPCGDVFLVGYWKAGRVPQTAATVLVATPVCQTQSINIELFKLPMCAFLALWICHCTIACLCINHSCICMFDTTSLYWVAFMPTKHSNLLLLKYLMSFLREKAPVIQLLLIRYTCPVTCEVQEVSVLNATPCHTTPMPITQKSLL